MLLAFATWRLVAADTLDAPPLQPAPSSTAISPVEVNVFSAPWLQTAFIRGQRELARLFAEEDYAGAERVSRRLDQIVPRNAVVHYNLACAIARQGRRDEAITVLSAAVALGFLDAAQMRSDDDLATLHSDNRFQVLLERAENADPPAKTNRSVRINPGVIRDGVAWIAKDNTLWDGRNGVFRTFFKLPDVNPISSQVLRGPEPAALLLNQWYAEGTAAGNWGDLYDNRDTDHSNLTYLHYPQLSRIEYTDAAKQLGLHHGLQTRFFFNGVTFGNSSTAITSGPLSRSQPRLALFDPHSVAVLVAQYVNGHLYVYPEHRDHDAERGDLYPANTPYFIISQGSSGSDKAFLRAVANTLAAFRPEVKELLIRNHMLMPTVQMILRRSNKQVIRPQDYLTGHAHPSAFDATQLDMQRMIKLAHEMTPERVPPEVRLRVVEEVLGNVGRDYFEDRARERLLDTAFAIARVGLSTNYERRLIVSAEASRDINERPLVWKWVVLRGDVTRIRIKPMNDAGSVVELLVPYHNRGPVPGNPKLTTHRVDIGVFVHNGDFFSAPAFISIYMPPVGKRVYNNRRLIETVDYADYDMNKRYLDPLLSTRKDWRDEYHYDTSDHLIGWTRIRGDQRQQFTADGALVLETDALGRATRAQSVRYAAKAGSRQSPTLEQQLGDVVLKYNYAGPEDRIGYIVTRERIIGSGGLPAGATP